MDWFHCNRCFGRKGQKFAVSSCGHILCEGCINPKQCNICGATCNYLPITDQMKPPEKAFFMDPMKLIQSRMEHIAQIALFQQTQRERVTAYFKHQSVELERQLSELKRENAELKKPLSQRRTSPGQLLINGTQRMSLPVAVTSPVTPCSRNRSHPGSAESQGRSRDRRPRLTLTTPPGSATSISSLSSLQERGFRTQMSLSTPTRTQHHSPNIFQVQLFSGSLYSPRQLRNGR
ncbi:RING finger protein 212B isoform X2 [Myripristis murdjan]|uniref:RING finger protein 212B isoform X2 n=1 Tax=Myripristis murdjan TaxID=586833 RepID=UPI001175EBD6|nr:RING finger protein 212B isoform X2 [Myripristis murdjan]